MVLLPIEYMLYIDIFVLLAYKKWSKSY